MTLAYVTDQHGVDQGPHWLLAQSRNRFIHPGNDNHGFARWVIDNAQELTRLGPGYHYGEWWGQGIQRGYGLTEKRFSLFNVSRWDNFSRPGCCHVVPLLGYCLPSEVDRFVDLLRDTGSFAAPGFKNPEGVVLWHSASRTYCGKILLDNDGEHKGERHESRIPLEEEIH
jgi:hypothetical protein